MTIQGMQDAQEAYVDFDDNHKAPDAENLKTKVSIFESMNGNPEYLIMVFLTMIMLAGNSQEGPFAGDGSSFARNQENQLTEVGKELNYLSAYRNTISEIKNDGGKNGGVADWAQMMSDLSAMDQYRTQGFTDNAPQIFQDDDSFTKPELDIKSVWGAVKNQYGSNFQALWAAAQKAGDQDAGALVQQFTNAVDGLQSAVGVQNNVLTTQMQDIESNYKSDTSWVAQMIKSLFAIITNAITRSVTQ